jgi:hypothetical protein
MVDRRHSATLWVTAALAGLACSGPAASSPATQATSSCENLAAGQQPEWLTPPAVEIPESRVTVEASVTLKRIERELSDRVPSTLDRGSRGIGSAGRLGYVVRRGAFAVGLEGERLVVTTPVTVNAQVCKPIGPFCPTYGSCSPKLQTRASVPLVLGPDYRLGQSEVGITIERSCSIAGFDATPKIRTAARGQARQLKRQIDGIVNQPRPEAEVLWRNLQQPLPLADQGCLRVKPRTLTQSRPSLVDGVLSTQVALTGTVSFDYPCDGSEGPAAAAQPLPKPQVVDELPGGIELNLPILQDWAAVSAELTRSLVSGTDPGAEATDPARQLTGVTALGALIEQQPLVALALHTQGCGDLWVVGEPWYDPAAKRAKLRKLRPLIEGHKLDDAMAALVTRLAEQGSLGLPLDLTATAAKLRELLDELTAKAPADVVLEVALEPPSVDQLLVAPTGIVAVAKATGHLRARLR